MASNAAGIFPRRRFDTVSPPVGGRTRIGQGNVNPNVGVVPQQGSIDEPVEHLQEGPRPTASYLSSSMRIPNPPRTRPPLYDESGSTCEDANDLAA